MILNTVANTALPAKPTVIKVYPPTRNRLREIARKLAAQNSGRHIGMDETVNHLIDAFESAHSEESS